MDLSVQNITVDLGQKQKKRVLDKVSFRANSGEFISLLGVSGAGKSTLLRVIAGILIQDEGSVCFDGACMDDVPAHRRGLGFVFQDMRLFPHLNVEENVAFPCKMAGMSKRERVALAREMLGQVQLEGFGSRSVQSLSGGQQQRVALARALAGKPSILLLDEPFSGLDEHLRDDMRSLVLRLHRDFGMTTVMVTHDALEAIEMSDGIVYLDAGEVVQTGSPKELFEKPASKAIAACFGDCSVIEGVVEGGEFVAGPLRMPSFGCVPGNACAVVRHAGVRLADESARALPVRCCVYRGDAYVARLDVQGQTLTVLVSHPLEEGEFVSLDYIEAGCFVYPRHS